MSPTPAETDILLRNITETYSSTWFPNPRFAYAFWVAGHIAKGGKIDYFGEPDCQFISNHSIIKPAHGAKAATFLIQPGQDITIQRLHSHNAIYDMRTFTAFNQDSRQHSPEPCGITHGIRDQIQMYRATREAFEAQGISLTKIVDEARAKTEREEADREIQRLKHLKRWDR